MAGATVLVVEDSPVSLKLMAAVLRGEGYQVQIASTAEQALSTLRFLRPALVLVDLFLPGMSGLDLTIQIRRDPRLRDVPVVAMTASTMEGDEERARAAGCDDYLTKPIDGPTLLMRVRQFLHLDDNVTPAMAPEESGAPVADEPVPQAYSFGLPEAELEDLRTSFLSAGLAHGQQLLAALDTGFDAVATTRLAHQWSGAGGLLGFPRISERAREVENQLRMPVWSAARLRETLLLLIREFHNRSAATPDAGIPDMIVKELQAKRIGLIGLADWEADRICAALERVGAKPRMFASEDAPDLEAIRILNAVILHVRPETLKSPWLAPTFVPPPGLPLVFIGGRELLLSLDPGIQARAREFLIDGWQPEEALMRVSFALSRPLASIRSGPGTSEPAAQGNSTDVGPETVVIADDDVTVRTVVEATLRRYGWRCRMATNGVDALHLIRECRPRAAVLDVNMPGMDGFEVLAAIRAEQLAVRVIVLTARRQEPDILRGFCLGSDDYVVKPFRPMELVARLNRLLVR